MRAYRTTVIWVLRIIGGLSLVWAGMYLVSLTGDEAVRRPTAIAYETLQVATGGFLALAVSALLEDPTSVLVYRFRAVLGWLLRAVGLMLVLLVTPTLVGVSQTALGSSEPINSLAFSFSNLLLMPALVVGFAEALLKTLGNTTEQRA